jgi:sulfatase maturation enzyme AslB (radical SAM superfamily)
MDWNVMREAIEFLLQSDRDEVRLVFYGGEPLLQFPLIRRAVSHAERVRPAGKAVRYGIITNGTLISGEIAEFLARHRVSTRLSFDGVAEAQAQRGESTFALIDSLLRRLRRDHREYFRHDLRIQMTALPATLGHLTESVRYLIDMGICEIDLGPCDNRDLDWRPERIAELDREMGSLFRLCLDHFRETGETPMLPFRRSRGERPAKSNGRAVCGIERAESLAVDVDGQVHGCLALAESVQSFSSEALKNKIRSLRLGEIGSPDLLRRLAGYSQALRAARIFHNKQERYSSYGRCRDCAEGATCGVCPIAIGRAADDGDIARVPDFACAFHLVMQRYRDRFPPQPGLEDRLAGRVPLHQLMQRLHEAAEESRRARRRGPG